MGSGETAPTMVKVPPACHRAARGGDPSSGPGRNRTGAGADSDPAPVHGLLLDTPFGFQTNARRSRLAAVDYFRDSVGATLEVAGLRSGRGSRAGRRETPSSPAGRRPLVFSGPGSPTYALRQWRGTLVPAVLAEKLALGGRGHLRLGRGADLGAVTVPVYEVYKVGEDPHWIPGLDLLRALGLPVALIPHYDNAEGGTHDTRFCYLGEERLAEHGAASFPTATFVLGRRRAHRAVPRPRRRERDRHRPWWSDRPRPGPFDTHRSR